MFNFTKNVGNAGCLIAFLLLLIGDVTKALNLATDGSTLRYLQSPLVKRFGRSSKVPGKLPRGVSPSFYGYDFTVDKQQLTIGAPKIVDPRNPSSQPAIVQPNTAKGDITSCPTSSLFDGTALPGCNSITPPNAAPGDSFGLNLGENDKEKFNVCSPTKVQQCTVVSYSPGYCYNSVNGGKTWSADKKSRKTVCPVPDLDIMFVLDGSASVKETGFTQVKNWTMTLSSYFDIESGASRIGVVQYSHYYIKWPARRQKYMKTEIALGSCKTHACFDAKVKNISLQKYTTYTAHALNKTVRDFRSSERFRDRNTSKILILLTDGRSSDFKKIKYSANYVRSLGITIFAVGVGKYDKNELRTIATGDVNSNNRVYQVDDFSNLKKIVNKLKSAIISVSLEGSAGANTASYDLEMGETGFSSAKGKVIMEKQMMS